MAARRTGRRGGESRSRGPNQSQREGRIRSYNNACHSRFRKIESTIDMRKISAVHCSELSLHGSARLRLIKPQTTLRPFRTTVRLRDFCLVDQVRVHFP
jgi:hypothetical protein